MKSEREHNGREMKSVLERESERQKVREKWVERGREIKRDRKRSLICVTVLNEVKRISQSERES